MAIAQQLGVLLICLSLVVGGFFVVTRARQIHNFMIDHVFRLVNIDDFPYSPWSYWSVGAFVICFGTWGIKTMLLDILRAEALFVSSSNARPQESMFGLVMMCLVLLYGLVALVMPEKLIRWSFRMSGARDSKTNVNTPTLVVCRILGIGLILLCGSTLLKHLGAIGER